jgi:antitoxin (DNA-binding transcriptional repressor) of toxin-antitoxin stability system
VESLDFWQNTGKTCNVKTVLKRDFFRTPALVGSLRPGEQLTVTDHGQTVFVVLKPPHAPSRTTAELARLASRLLPGRGRKIDVVQKLRALRG